MPELPDIILYVDALRRTIGNQVLNRVSLRSPFLLRSVVPPLSSVEGLKVEDFRRIGKRIVWELEGDTYLLFHLMIAGRFRWLDPDRTPKGKTDLAAFHFDSGTMMLTEAGSKKGPPCTSSQERPIWRSTTPGVSKFWNARNPTFATPSS